MCARIRRGSDIKRARRLSTLDFIFYTRGERKKGGKKNGVKSVRWKAKKKSKTRRKGRGRLHGPMRDARKTRWERRAPVFRGGWKNICIHPRPSSPSIGRAILRYRLRRLHIPKFRQPKRLSYRASAFSSLHSIPYPFSSPSPFPSLLSLLARQFSYPLPPSLSRSSLLSLPPARTILILSLFSSRWRNVHQKI